MSIHFKPLLAHTIEDTSAIKYPVLVSCKLDGIRCIVIDGVAYSRSLKPIRNKYVQQCIGKREYNGLDGEIIVGDIYDKACYRTTNSGVMAADGEPDFTFHVFDRLDLDDVEFDERYQKLPDNLPFMKIVPHIRVFDEAGLLGIESELLAAGAEGVMVRSPNGVYKQGRSTIKDGILGKLKRFTDSDFLVVGFEERLHNGNVATINALGHTERSSHKENKTGRGDLGALVLQTPEGTTFTCGSGFSDAQRSEVWANQDKYLGTIAKIKHFDYGVKDHVRFPVFLGFRDPIDI